MFSQPTTNYQDFSSKVHTLAVLKPILSRSMVLDMVHFSVTSWQQNPQRILKQLTKKFAPQSVIVRSSAVDEDNPQDSKAGVYRSHLHISSADRQALTTAIEDVIASYPPKPGHSVFVQPMLGHEDVHISGVASTHSLQSGAPYYTISYDKSGHTDQVTRGTGTYKLVYVARSIHSDITPTAEIAQLISVLQELETILPNRVLEIEFALTHDRRCILFQVRPFSVKLARSARQSARTHLLQQAKQAIIERNQPQPGWLGEQTVLGVMCDWNPAEIIGLHPRPLATSLYQSLITQQVWQQARISMGYRNIPQQDLMLLIAGRPFVDVRMSFNSWLPATLPDSIGSLLINAWLDQLKQHPQLHDKVEFEIVHTCYELDGPSRLQQQYGNLLSKSQLLQLSDALHTLTRQCLKIDTSSSFDVSLQAIHSLHAQQCSQNHTNSSEHLLLHAQRQLQHCQTLGTLPFAVLARHAFIAESLLKSAVRCEALSPARYEQFKRSIKTIFSEIATAMNQVRQGQLQPAQFMARYGHLRPGTYDIRALRYADRNNLFTGSAAVQETPATMDFVLTAYEHRHTDWLLKQARFDGINADGLMKYASQAIAAREMSKFVFSRALSDALEAMALWGASHDLDRDALSFLSVDDMMHCVEQCQDSPQKLQKIRQTIEQNRDIYQLQSSIKLGQLVTGPDDLDIIRVESGIANYIGQARVEAEPLTLSHQCQTQQDLSGKIICIESADPGYDWIFTGNIAALVTCFGGPNSHMAIRCTEFGLPAAIGCGESLYRRTQQAEKVILDCENQTLRPLLNFD